ncbi:hypothetical protein UFOVP1608_41 [uncultured Caudovirales phage]|uniref:LT_GEWL domain containing protein n=1 Tax=uncultured Caudovirales phage TaxID=2100421 RepID=A0A6J5SU73_9CAUD|nr:hypothetical protein UFOVP1608_41 [uncultured Caudovirales phage]
MRRSLCLALTGALLWITPTHAAAPIYHRAAVVTTQTVRDFVQAEALERGWSGKEWKCLDDLIDNESRWNFEADNPHSSAFGLFQILKTPEDTPIEVQVARGFRYIDARYGSPCKAWNFWTRADLRGSPWY